MRKIARVTVLTIVLCCIVAIPEVFGLVYIHGVRHWTAPDYTRIVIDTSDKVKYSTVEKDHVLCVDISNTAFPSSIPSLYHLDKPAVKKISIAPLSGKGVRIKVWLGETVKTHVFALGKILDKPHRIVVDVKLPAVEKEAREARKKVKVLKEKRVVVIDPGHGGEDPGAVGRGKTLEKDVVLKISKKLRNILRKRGYQAYLTRNGDYYVSFKRRLGIAREYGADLFISVHADACRKRGVRGASVYCLSTRGASNEAARLLAHSQNLSDIIGGAANGDTNDESDPITLNMLQTETINQSKLFGTQALTDLKRINRLKFTRVQEAPFRVLKLPDIPSILVETAYISNSREERMLRSSAYQTDVAWAIASAVNNFLPLPYSPKTVIVRKPSRSWSSHTGADVMYVTYRVRKGDSLEGIAREKGTTVDTLMRLNGIRSKNRIYVGQKLKIPGSLPVETYRVRKGDTLAGIARRHGTTINTLLQLNNLKSRNRIYVGQRLKIPSDMRTLSSTYVVKKGDTLARIAGLHGTTVNALMRLNRLNSKNRIYVGQKLKISSTGPAPSTYFVKKGDTLAKIAGRSGTTVNALLRTNNLKSKNRIYVGQKLTIP